MDGLRWLLLVCGLLVIAGVYFYSRREKSVQEDRYEPVERVEPTLTAEDVATSVAAETSLPDPGSQAFFVVGKPCIGNEQINAAPFFQHKRK